MHVAGCATSVSRSTGLQASATCAAIDTQREDHNEQRPHSALGYQPPANFAVAILAAQQSTGRTALSSNISSQGSKESLNKSSVERVAGKIGMIPRRTPQVIAWSTRPRQATQGALDFAATLRVVLVQRLLS